MSSPNFQHPPSTMLRHSRHRIPLPQAHLQGQRGQNICLHPQVTAATPRVPLSSAYGIMHQQFLELEPRRTRDPPPHSDRMAYNPHQGCVHRRCSTSQMRVPEEDVTILSISLTLLYTIFYYSEYSGCFIFCITFLIHVNTILMNLMR